MGSRFGSYQSHSNAFICPGCGNSGSVQWEGNGTSDQKQMVGVKGDFFERLSKTAPYPIELVCNNCGTVQKDAA